MSHRPAIASTSASRRSVFAPIEPYASGRLEVSGGHSIYYEVCGNPRGHPAVVVHGGPGGGSNPTMRRYHDPSRYRIILFDQRGCGRSTPHACLEHNTTWDLVADMEQLRRHLGVERWQVVGGSWGSTLALAYAQTHPHCVSQLILRGIFLLREAEIAWFYQEGCSWLYPDAFERFVSVIPEPERDDLVSAFHRRLTHPDRAVQLAAARAWSMWEGATLSLYPDPEREKLFGADNYAIAFARIECHYFMNRGFFEVDDQLLRDAHRIAGIPGVIVQGRHDVVTPMKSAWDLHRAWPTADLRIVPDAGHAMTEPGTAHEILMATQRFG